MHPDHRQVHRDPIRNNDHVQFFGVLCVRKLRKRQVSAFIDSLKFLINCLNLYERFFAFCFPYLGLTPIYTIFCFLLFGCKVSEIQFRNFSYNLLNCLVSMLEKYHILNHILGEMLGFSIGNLPMILHILVAEKRFQ